MEKVFEDKEFHGAVTFFGSVIYKSVSVFTFQGGFSFFGDMVMSLGDLTMTDGSLVLTDGSITLATGDVIITAGTVVIPSTERILLDGSISGNTYIVESASDIIDLVAGGIVAMQAKVAGVLFALGFQTTSQQLVPTNSTAAGNTILPNTRNVEVIAPANGVNDWILLPSLSAVPIGHQIIIACNSGGAFEMRTPAASDELINNVNADGDALEYACIDEEIITVTKLSATDGWVATGTDDVGAITTPVIPD